MGKTVKEKANEWGCSESTVRSYLKSGIIPMAEKIGMKWVLPDECKKPPLTRHGLCFLLDTIEQVKAGGSLETSYWGISEEQIIEGYRYLVSLAFMKEIKPENYREELKNSAITMRGKNLIEQEIKENPNSKLKFHLQVKGTGNVGVAAVEVSAGLSNS